MSSDNRIHMLPRRGLVLGLALLLASCQVRPLYQDHDGSVKTTLASIAYSAADNRVGLETRNRLIFLTSGGKEATTPEYRVELDVTISGEGILLDEGADTPNTGRMVVTGTYSLSRISDQEVLKTGKRQAVALFDYPRQEFAKLRAQRDAENRAARELAELIYADLAMAVGR